MDFKSGGALASVAQLGGVLSHTPEDCRLDSQSVSYILVVGLIAGAN